MAPPGSGLSSSAQIFPAKSRANPCSETVLSVSVSVPSSTIQRPHSKSPVETPIVKRPVSPLHAPLETPTRPVLRCGRRRELAPHTVRLPSIREEVDLHECTSVSASEAPLDAGQVFPDLVEKNSRDPNPSASSQERGNKYDDNPDQVAPILHARRTIYEVDSATLRPFDLSPSPDTPKDHNDEVLALHSTLPFEESSYTPEHVLTLLLVLLQLLTSSSPHVWRYIRVPTYARNSVAWPCWILAHPIRLFKRISGKT